MKVCDRCFNTYGEEVKYSVSVIRPGYNMAFFTGDLCQSHYEELIKWMGNEEETDEQSKS